MNQEHLGYLRQGFKNWNSWRSRNKTIKPDLSEVTLASEDLRKFFFAGTDFRGADLRAAVFSGTDLSEVDFREANLSYANLEHTILRDANLSGAVLKKANLSNADLVRAFFIGASLEGADFHESLIGWTAFGNLDLSNAAGLGNINHIGPSSIDVETIYKSGGLIPDIFLSNAGVPEQFISFCQSLIGKVIKYHSVFISCSTEDRAFAEVLYSDLMMNNVRTWFAPKDLRIGEKLRVGIDKSILSHDKLILILSKSSMTSDWVEGEVEAALEKEKQSDQEVLFPIKLDNTVTEVTGGWPAKIRRTRYIGDFCNWNDKVFYRKAFQRLLEDLRMK